MRELTVISALLALGLLLSCSSKKEPSQKQTALLKGDDVVLALVNNSPITQYELDQAVESTLGKENKRKVRVKGRQNMLESLVRSRAVAQARDKELNDKERAVLDKQVQEYREQLLVKQYLAKHTQIEPVSTQMIEKYYKDNPDKFGGKAFRIYEMIASQRSLVTQEKKKVIQALKNGADIKDWKQLAATLKEGGLPIIFKMGQVQEKLFESDLQQLIDSLKVGQTSALSFIKGRAYMVRITEEKKKAPQPLSEVSAVIRQSLTPVQLKKAVKEASEQVMKNAKVVYK